jgi:hypothetical protein
MMMIRFIAILLLLFSAVLIRADVPPEPGYKRVSLSIILEPQDDFQDFRVFLVSGQSVKDVVVKKGERTTVGSIGAGARYRNGALLAVPIKSLAMFGETPTVEKRKEMEQAILEENVKGTIKLAEHRFTQEVRTSEADSLQDPVFRLERTQDGGITATRVADETNSKRRRGNVEFEPYGVAKDMTPLGWFTIVAGCLLTLALITFGVLVFRRSTN